MTTGASARNTVELHGVVGRGDKEKIVGRILLKVSDPSIEDLLYMIDE